MVVKKKKVGIFGLTGNPVHFGHKNVILQALSNLDEVWVTLVFNHPWGKNPVEYIHRLKMCEIMFENMANVKIVEMDKRYYEQTKKVPYSYNILCMARDNYDVEPVLIIGEDNYIEKTWKKFYNYKKIEDEFSVFVAKDKGIHSTTIRKLVQNKQWDLISTEVGQNVLKYIQDNNLYTSE